MAKKNLLMPPKGRKATAQGNSLGHESNMSLSPEGAASSANWPIVPLGEIASTTSGGTPSRSRSDYYGGNIPWIKSGDLNDGFVTEATEFIHEVGLANSAAKMIPAGAVMIALYGATIGRLGLLEIDAATNQAVCSITVPPSIDRKFLFHFLHSKRQNLINLGKGGAQPNISQQIIRELPIPLPPLSEQRRIVAEIEKQFTRLDVGVAALRRVQAHLERYRTAVLKAACDGRLVPTEAELRKSEAGDRNDFESGKDLLTRILKERRSIHDRMEITRNRKRKYKEPVAPEVPPTDELPEGWVWATWDQIGFSQNGRPFQSSEYQSIGFKLLRPGNLHKSGKVVWTEENTRSLPDHRAEENPDLIVLGGELVMNLTAQSLKDEFLGRVCLTAPGDACLLNQRLARLTPVIVSKRYVLCLLKAWRFRRFVDGLNSGSLIQHMFTSQLAEFTFPLPPLAEQSRIVAEVERRLSVVEELEALVSANLQRAARLRQAVLLQSFNGDLA